MAHLTPLFVCFLAFVSAFAWEEGDRPIRKLEITAQVDSCSVMTTRGLVSLHPLDNIKKSSDSPAFANIKPKGGDRAIYSYNPCTPFTANIYKPMCKNVAVCQSYSYDISANRTKSPVKNTEMATYPPYPTFPVGSHGSATFGTDGDRLWISYETADGYGLYRVTTITLDCNSEVEGSLSGVGEGIMNSAKYDFTLTSKYACPKRMPEPMNNDRWSTSTITPMTPASEKYLYHIIMLSLLGFIALSLLTLVCITCAVLGRLTKPHKKVYNPPPYLIQAGK